MDRRGAWIAFALVLAVSGTVQAATVEEGPVDEHRLLPELVDSPDLGLEGGDPAPDDVSARASVTSALAGVLDAARQAAIQSLEAAGEAAAIAADAFAALGVAAAETLALAAAATVQTVLAALVRLFEHPAMRDPAVRAGASAAVASAPVAAFGAGWLAWQRWLSGIGLGAMPLYSRIQKSEVLDNPVRQRIFEHICENPGTHTSEIADDLDLGWGTTVHHLKHLQRHDLISKRNARNHTCYFENGGTYSPQEQEAIAALKNDKARRIVRYVQRQPGSSQKELAEGLDLSQSLVSWHVSKLEKAGLVGRERNGRRSELQPTDDVPHVLGTAE